MVSLNKIIISPIVEIDLINDEQFCLISSTTSSGWSKEPVLFDITSSSSSSGITINIFYGSVNLKSWVSSLLPPYSSTITYLIETVVVDVTYEASIVMVCAALLSTIYEGRSSTSN